MAWLWQWSQPAAKCFFLKQASHVVFSQRISMDKLFCGCERFKWFNPAWYFDVAHFETTSVAKHGRNFRVPPKLPTASHRFHPLPPRGHRWVSAQSKHSLASQWGQSRSPTKTTRPQMPKDAKSIIYRSYRQPRKSRLSHAWKVFLLVTAIKPALIQLVWFQHVLTSIHLLLQLKGCTFLF